MQQSSIVNRQSLLARPTLDHVWLVAALALIALRPLLTPIPPNDFWWHMATGRLIVAEQTIPVVDQFSYTQAGAPFYNQSWLAQMLMYGLHWLGGLPLLIIVQVLVIVLAYGLLLRLCALRTRRLRLSITVLLLSLPMVFDNWTVRPQSYALPLFAAFLTILTEYRLGRANRLWLLPLLMVLWVNIHGSFVLGLGLVGLTFVGELFHRRWTMDDRRLKGQYRTRRPSSIVYRPLLVWGALTALAMLLNPRGVGVLGYVRDLLGSSAVATLVTEWAPPTTRDATGLVFFVFVLVCIGVLAMSCQRPPLADMLMLLAFLWLAFGGARHVIWFGMVAVPLLTSQLAALLPAPARRAAPGVPLLNGVLIGLLALLLVAGLPWFKPALFPSSVGALLSADTPVAAVDALERLPARPQRLFHTEGDGSYLIWAAPEQPVFIDPRIELYPYQQWTDYITLSQGHNVSMLLQKYQFDGMLLSTERQAALIDAVRAAGWQTVYQDAQTVLVLR